MAKIKEETPADYSIAPISPSLTSLMNRALKALKEEMVRKDIYSDMAAFTTPDLVKNYLTLALALEPIEHFHCLFLDNQHKLLEDRRLCSGTIDGASIYPREVIKAALQINAAAVIFAHNHPSGVTEPSHADKAITTKLVSALQLIDIRVLDHVIVGKMDTFSLAENGMV